MQNNDPKTTPITANPTIFKREIQSLSASIIQKDLIKEEKQLSIFDLFENSEEQLIVAVPKAIITKKQPTKRKRVVNGYQPNLFSGAMRQSYIPPVPNTSFNGNTSNNSNKSEIIGDLFSTISTNDLIEKTEPTNTITEPTFYTKEIQSFHRNECLVVDNGQVGYLKDLDNDRQQAIFHPLHLAPLQKAKAESYIAVRYSYLDLYQKEAEKQTEHKEERGNLNKLYDDFIKRYGNLNSTDNIKIIKTDSAERKFLIWNVWWAAWYIKRIYFINL